LQKL